MVYIISYTVHIL